MNGIRGIITTFGQLENKTKTNKNVADSVDLDDVVTNDDNDDNRNNQSLLSFGLHVPVRSLILLLLYLHLHTQTHN